MHPPPLDILMHIALGALFSSCTGGVSYGLCRQAEGRYTSFAIDLIVTALLTGVVIVLLVVVLSSLVSNLSGVLYVSALLAFWALGAFFHLRSGGRSSSIDASYCLIVIATLLSLFLGMIFYSVFGYMVFRNEPWIMGAYSVGVFVYPTLTPIALTIWQSLKIKPGIDEAEVPGESN